MHTAKKLLLALNKIEPGFTFIAERQVVCGTEHAFRLPMGKCANDVQKVIDTIGAAAGAPVEIVDRGGAVVLRVVEKDFPLKMPFKEEHFQRDRLLLGYDRLHNPVYLNLMHQLIGGASGAGKTMLLRFLLYQMQRIGAIIKIVDMKGFSFFPFEPFRNVTIAKNLESAADLLHAAAEELEARESRIIMARDRSLTRSFTPYVIVIDEAAQIAPKMYSGKMKEYARYCDETCARISQKGRESKVFLIYCTQKPSHDIVNGQVKANVESAIAFRTNNHYESKVILDDTGAERISVLTRGRCIFRFDRTLTVQVPFIGEDDADWAALLEPLKVEVLHHGSSKRAEPPRKYIEGSFTSADRDHEAAGDAQRFTGSAEKGVAHPSRARGRATSQRGVPPQGKGVVAHQARAAAHEHYTDEVE
jgi:S-DNA-T family DNA segregation ATPase FtsK/SpoIIIE